MKISTLLLILIFGFGLLVRIIAIEQVPNGLNQDETAIGYNAYSILKTGKDEHGVSYPLYFKSFNDYKLPVYIYATTLPLSILGMTPFAVRFFSILAGIAALLLIYLVSKKLFSAPVALASAFLLAINPWHLFFSRAAFEVNLATTLLLSGVYLFIWAISSKKYWLLYGSLVSFGLSLYTYNVTRLIAPALLLFLVFLYRKELKQVQSSMRYSILVLMAVILTPFIWAIVSGMDGLSNQTSQLLINGVSKAEMIELRSYALSLPMGVGGLLFNRALLIPWEYIKNVFGFFSIDYFFLSGDSSGNTSIGNYGMFHVFEFITILAGAVWLYKKKTVASRLILGWAGIIIFIVSMSNTTPHPTRSYPLVIPLTIMSAVGFVRLYEWVSSKKRVAKTVAVTVSGSIIAYSAIFFLTSYFFRFPILYADKWRSEEQKLSLYLEEQSDSYDRIIIDPRVDMAYTSLLFYQSYDPALYQKDSSYVSNGQLLRMEHAGMYEIRTIDWESDGTPGTIIVSSPEYAPESYHPERSFFYPKRPVVLFFDNQIAQYPTQDVAFAVYQFSKE